jgi:hypothetical protein
VVTFKHLPLYHPGKEPQVGGVGPRADLDDVKKRMDTEFLSRNPEGKRPLGMSKLMGE